jgi:hypothetical protein
MAISKRGVLAVLGFWALLAVLFSAPKFFIGLSVAGLAVMLTLMIYIAFSED